MLTHESTLYSRFDRSIKTSSPLFTVTLGNPSDECVLECAKIGTGPWPEGSKATLYHHINGVETTVADFESNGRAQVTLVDGRYIWKVTGLTGREVLNLAIRELPLQVATKNFHHGPEKSTSVPSVNPEAAGTVRSQTAGA